MFWHVYGGREGGRMEMGGMNVHVHITRGIDFPFVAFACLLSFWTLYSVALDLSPSRGKYSTE